MAFQLLSCSCKVSATNCDNDERAPRIVCWCFMMRTAVIEVVFTTIEQHAVTRSRYSYMNGVNEWMSQRGCRMQLMEKMNEERNQDATAAAASSLLTGVVVVESGVWTTRVDVPDTSCCQIWVEWQKRNSSVGVLLKKFIQLQNINSYFLLLKNWVQ